jgi:hypothetical protein
VGGGETVEDGDDEEELEEEEVEEEEVGEEEVMDFRCDWDCRRCLWLRMGTDISE